MMFTQTSWEKAAPLLEAYRAEYRQHNHGEEAPPLSIVDFVSCFADAKKAEEIARRHIVGYYWDLMQHYELTGSHFADTGKAYQYYAKSAAILNAVGHEAAIEEFLASNLYGTPDVIVQKLRHRREMIGDFEVNGVFTYQSIPYDQVEQCMRLFAKEVAPEIHSWQPQARRQPVAVTSTAAAISAK
jgi:alkanesulfonate monooxygenase SsuD/methylene tetrahydromethanopterin reductase-like flavin-dependent oxidoreductase (luciferase family)